MNAAAPGSMGVNAPPPSRGRSVRWTLAGVALAAVAVAGGYALDRVRARALLEQEAAELAQGNVTAGRAVVARHGCGGCHEIPGIAGAHGLVGPPLDGFARRAYVGGVLENTPSNLVRWLQDPRAVDPKTAMPAVGLDERAARDAAAFLYTLD